MWKKIYDAIKKWLEDQINKKIPNPIPTDPKPSDPSVPNTPDNTETPILQNGDEIDITKIKYKSANAFYSDKFIKAPVTAKITDASINSRFMNTKYEKYNWECSDGLDAMCLIFYREGNDIVGGKFDWWRCGGQGTKTIENVHAGYGGLKMPAVNGEVWTAICDKKCMNRSNIKKARWG